MIHVMAGDRPHRLESPVWLTANRNGIIRTAHEPLARGILIDDEIHNLQGKEPLGDYPEAKIITTAEYLEALGRTEPDPDPELTDEEAFHIMMGGTYETE